MSYETPPMTKMLMALGVIMPPCLRSVNSAWTPSLGAMPGPSGIVIPPGLPSPLPPPLAAACSSERLCDRPTVKKERNERNCRRQKKNRDRRRGR